MPTRYWILTIVTVAALLRLFPIWFGLPHLYARPDEEVAIAKASGVLRGDFNPHFFHWPSLTFYIFAAMFALARGVRSLAGFDPALTGAQQLLIARACVACAGGATVYVLYRIGRRIDGPATGLIAAFFLAFAVLHVRDSHFAMTDVLMTLFVTVSLALILRALDTDRSPVRWFALAGVAGGLAASTKYNGAAILAAMGAAQLVLWSRDWRSAVRPRTWAPSLVFVLSLVSAFVVTTPYAVLDFASFKTDLIFDFTHLSEGHSIELGLGWIYHATHSLPYGAGMGVFAAAVPGAVLLAAGHPRHGFVVLTFFAAFYLAIGHGYTVFFRYVMPLVPLVCLFAALAMRAGGEWLVPRLGLAPGATLAALALLVGAPSILNAVWFDLVLARTDTRVIARQWLAPQLTPDSTLYDAGGNYASIGLTPLRYHDWHFNAETRSFGHPVGETPQWLVLPESPLLAYTLVPSEVRALAATRYEMVKEIAGTTGQARSAMYDQQDAFFMPVSGFWTVVRPGPTIKIYRRSDGR